LDLSQNALDAETVQTLADSLHLSELRDLQLAHCYLNGASVTRLRSAPWLANLALLSLSGNPIGDAALSTLLGGGGPTRIHELKLHSCGLWASTAQALVNAELTELHWLDLSGNGLDGSATEVISRSRLAGNLVELGLGGNSIGDAGAISIAACSWPLLRKLALGSIQMTSKGVLALDDSQSMPRLQEVHCPNNSIGWETFRQVGHRFRQW
jgi:Ran GTPase-activating protein (RanGAP) involved in mRNA processing and transport